VAFSTSKTPSGTDWMGIVNIEGGFFKVGKVRSDNLQTGRQFVRRGKGTINYVDWDEFMKLKEHDFYEVGAVGQTGFAGSSVTVGRSRRACM